MNSSHSHSQSWTPGAPTTHAGFADVHQHLDDNSHLFDDIIKGAQQASETTTASAPQPKAKVLFQFFDGWPMSNS